MISTRPSLCSSKKNAPPIHVSLGVRRISVNSSEIWRWTSGTSDGLLASTRCHRRRRRMVVGSPICREARHRRRAVQLCCQLRRGALLDVRSGRQMAGAYLPTGSQGSRSCSPASSQSAWRTSSGTPSYRGWSPDRSSSLRGPNTKTHLATSRPRVLAAEGVVGVIEILYEARRAWRGGTAKLPMTLFLISGPLTAPSARSFS